MKDSFSCLSGWSEDSFRGRTIVDREMTEQPSLGRLVPESYTYKLVPKLQRKGLHKFMQDKENLVAPETVENLEGKVRG